MSENAGQQRNKIQQDLEDNSGQALGQMSGGQAVNQMSGGQSFNISNSSVTFQDSQGNSLDPRALSQKREIPSLLTYLPNRTEQEFELGQAIQSMMGRSLMQPLICVVHGDEQQSHDTFLERLRKVSLPRLLRLDLKKTAVKDYHLQWPASLKKLEMLPARLTKNLADTVQNDSFATVEDINRTFSKYPGPVLVHLHLMTDDWKRLGPELLSEILTYWQNWPKLGFDQTLVVCIFIKYQRYTLQDSRKRRRYRWFVNPFVWFRRFLKCRRCQQLNLEIAEQLEGLAGAFSNGGFEGDGFEGCDRLTGVVLPKLDNLNRGHVEEWARCAETRKFAGDALVGPLLSAVGNMFDHDETMPMDTVAARLTDLLKSLVSERPLL